MTFSKQDLFTPQQIELAEFARSLSHPARIAIVTLLQNRGPVPCGAIVEALPLAQATVSQHLKALRDADLIHAQTSGLQVLYSLNCETIRNFCHSFQCTLGTLGDHNESTSAQPER